MIIPKDFLKYGTVIATKAKEGCLYYIDDAPGFIPMPHENNDLVLCVAKESHINKAGIKETSTFLLTKHGVRNLSHIYLRAHE